MSLKVEMKVIFLLCLAGVCFAQERQPGVTAVQRPVDDRPFGKYLHAICTVVAGEVSRCSGLEPALRRVPSEEMGRRINQTIAAALACNPAQTSECNPTYPVIPGADFFVRATSDSGRPVRQRVLSGSATPVGGTNLVHYRANAPGLIVIRATAAEDDVFAAAAPVDLLIQVSRKADKSASCAVLPPAIPATSQPMDAPAIVSMIGNPTPFLLTAPNSTVISIYATREPIRPRERQILTGIFNDIAALTGRRMSSLGISPAGKAFSVELRIPHALALGDLAPRLNTLNYSQFTIQDVGRDKVRVTATTTPDCLTWSNFLTDVKRLEWNLVSESMNTKLFYLSSSDVAAAFSALTPATPSGGSAGGSSGSPAGGTSGTGGGSSGGSGGGSSPGDSGTGGGTTAGAAGAATSANISINQPPGSNVQIWSDTTPCVVAGLAFGSSSACTPSQSTTSATTGGPSGAGSAATTNNAPATLSPLAMASVAVAAGTGEQNPPDLLVFSDTYPGDDAQIEERLRILAQLDLPRPEMIVSAWVTQNSSVNPKAVGAFAEMVKKTVEDYNLEFEYVIERAWGALKERAAAPDFYNESFARYVSNRFVADTFQAPKSGRSPQELAQAFLDSSSAELKDPVVPRTRNDLNLCDRGRYCLGYQTLFKGIRPSLTELLLVLIAAQNPIAAVRAATVAVQGSAEPVTNDGACGGGPGGENYQQKRDACKSLWTSLGLDIANSSTFRNSADGEKTDCMILDHEGILGSLITEGEPRVRLACFSRQAAKLMRAVDQTNTPPYTVGLLRAAVADFLFNYKLSQQYPHEFDAYELTRTANALNAALNPLVDAFNRDLTAYQMFVRADLQRTAIMFNSRKDERCCIKRIFGLDKPSLFNDGIVSVRTISGQPTSVSTTSQSSLNVSMAPELSTLLNTLVGTGGSSTGGGPGGGSSGGGSGGSAGGSGGSSGSGAGSGAGGSSAAPLASAFFSTTPLHRFEALAGALGQYQTTFAQIGRALSLQVTPRSLSTASSAEITVTLNADESAGGPVYTGGGANDPAYNTSRVAQHDTTTRIRVDSVKMFEVSSFSALVQKSRSRFPLLPPFVEIPYIGTFAGIPLPGAKEYHNSSAILTAYVVPTAADLAYGLRFSTDLLVDSANSGPCTFVKGIAGPDTTNVCVFRKAISLRDFGADQHAAPLKRFNEEMVRCLALDTSSRGCETLVRFDTVPVSQ